MLLSVIVLDACGSGSGHAPFAATSSSGGPSAPSVYSGPSVYSDPALGIQISPAPTPGFDRRIHDYNIDCTTSPDAQLAVASPRAIGFRYLGSTGHPAGPLPYSHVQFRQALTLKPGQGFRFAIAGLGSYSVRCLPPDFPPLRVERDGTPQAEWYLFSPTIGTTATAFFIIITDSQGTPVWWVRQPTTGAFDAKVLGSNRIAWSPGTTAGGGNGTYEFRSFDGHLTNTLTGNLDFHDMQPTPSGTYLAFRFVNRVCPPDCADMSAWGGGAQVSVQDAEILELDQNSNVLWIWRTRDHIALSESGDSGWFPKVGQDIIHMNALEPDGTDGLMFSARHLNAIYHITKSTGAIDWKIGGTPRPESLTVLGDLRPTATGANGQVLSGQHDVRKWPDGTVSVHDNGTLATRPPAIVRYRIDLGSRTAEVVEQIQDQRISGSICCGSARLLPGGNWVVQWGASPLVTELDPGGNPVLTIRYNMQAVFSYRAIPVPTGTVSADVLRDGMDAMSTD